MKICLIYHCLVFLDSPDKFAPSAIEVIEEQMDILEQSGLLAAADHFEVGINGGKESEVYASMLLPRKAQVTFHGLDSHNENSTIRMMEQWLPGHPGWAVLYFHAKGCTWPYNDPIRAPWRRCMNLHCLEDWWKCLVDLEEGYDAVGTHWMSPPNTPPSQNFFGGTFFWAKSDFLLTLPSILNRSRIKMSGLKSLESRFESEVWIGNGPRLPRVKDYHPGCTPRNIGKCHL